VPGDDRPLFAQHINPINPAQQAPFLAPVTWLMPPYNYSEHPPYTSADGAYYIANIVDALIQSEFWESTVLVLTYDEGNSAFDHLPPPQSPDPATQPPPQPHEPWVQDDSGTTDSGNAVNYPAPIGAGMRVPAIIISPWTYQRGIVQEHLDHTSILQLMETVTGVRCSTLPAAGAPDSWRRANFEDLYSVIDPDNYPAIPAQQITGVPTAAGAVLQWRMNADNRARRQGNQPAAPSSQSGPPIQQACAITVNLAGGYHRQDLLGRRMGQPAAHQSHIVVLDAITVVVSGFQAQEFIELDAGVPPLQSADNLPEVPLPGGGTCRSRVPVVEVITAASPGEISIGSCTQLSSDPNAATGQQEPLQLAFTFPLIFSEPALTVALPEGTAQVIELQASFTVDASVTALAELIVAGDELGRRAAARDDLDRRQSLS
jgi:Phosphoesterase family